MTVDEALEIVRENYRDDTSAGVLAAEVRRLRGENVLHKDNSDYHARRSVKLSAEIDTLRAELDRYCGECGGCDAHFKGCTNTDDVTSADGSTDESGSPGG